MILQLSFDFVEFTLITIDNRQQTHFAFRILNSNYIIIATTVAMANTIILRELSPIS